MQTKFSPEQLLEKFPMLRKPNYLENLLFELKEGIIPLDDNNPYEISLDKPLHMVAHICNDALNANWNNYDLNSFKFKKNITDRISNIVHIKLIILNPFGHTRQFISATAESALQIRSPELYQWKLKVFPSSSSINGHCDNPLGNDLDFVCFLDSDIPSKVCMSISKRYAGEDVYILDTALNHFASPDWFDHVIGELTVRNWLPIVN